MPNRLPPSSALNGAASLRSRSCLAPRGSSDLQALGTDRASASSLAAGNAASAEVTEARSAAATAASSASGPKLERARSVTSAGLGMPASSSPGLAAAQQQGMSRTLSDAATALEAVARLRRVHTVMRPPSGLGGGLRPLPAAPPGAVPSRRVVTKGDAQPWQAPFAASPFSSVASRSASAALVPQPPPPGTGRVYRPVKVGAGAAWTAASLAPKTRRPRSRYDTQQMSVSEPPLMIGRCNVVCQALCPVLTFDPL